MSREMKRAVAGKLSGGKRDAAYAAVGGPHISHTSPTYLPHVSHISHRYVLFVSSICFALGSGMTVKLFPLFLNEP